MTLSMKNTGGDDVVVSEVWVVPICVKMVWKDETTYTQRYLLAGSQIGAGAGLTAIFIWEDGTKPVFVCNIHETGFRECPNNPKRWKEINPEWVHLLREFHFEGTSLAEGVEFINTLIEGTSESAPGWGGIFPIEGAETNL